MRTGVNKSTIALLQPVIRFRIFDSNPLSASIRDYLVFAGPGEARPARTLLTVAMQILCQLAKPACTFLPPRRQKIAIRSVPGVSGTGKVQ
jgi:hypothetical protein